MKQLAFLFLFITLFLFGLNAQTRRGLNKRWRPTNSNGAGFSFKKNAYSYGNRNEGLAGSIFLSMSLGPSFLNGDMDGPLSKKISLGDNNMGSFAVTHILPSNIGYKLSYMFGKYQGSDLGSKIGNLTNRGYGYSTTLSEIALHGEYYILGGPYSPNSRSRYSRTITLHSLYVYGGAGLLFSNSLSNGVNQSYDKLNSYQKSATTPEIPFGIGYQYSITEDFLIGAEVGDHYTFGDYVDGLKHTNSSNDMLSHFAVTFTYKLYKDN